MTPDEVDAGTVEETDGGNVETKIAEADQSSTRYIGRKFLSAKPMTRGEYNSFDEEGSDEGYLVIYPEDYSSWSPKDVFEASYQAIYGGEMDFGNALACCKRGMTVNRKGWKVSNVECVRLKSMFRNLSTSQDLDSLERITFCGTLETNVNDYIPETCDILANDWFVVDIEESIK